VVSILFATILLVGNPLSPLLVHAIWFPAFLLAPYCSGLYGSDWAHAAAAYNKRSMHNLLFFVLYNYFETSVLTYHGTKHKDEPCSVQVSESCAFLC
jgi:hypothetical protein